MQREQHSSKTPRNWIPGLGPSPGEKHDRSKAIRSSIQWATIALYATVLLAGVTLFVLSVIGLIGRELGGQGVTVIAVTLAMLFFVFGVGLLQITRVILDSLER